MRLNASETELTTAATDALLGVLCGGLAFWLSSAETVLTWRRGLWTVALGLMSAGAFLGVVAHGLALSPAVRTRVWRPLYLSLGLVVAVVFTAAVHDWRGEAASRTVAPWALAAGAGFFAVAELRKGSFALFLAYEGAALVFALAVYATAALRRDLEGAALLAGGIVVSLVAAAVQASGARMQLLVPLDHNGLFHLVQMGGVLLMALGARAGLGR